MKIVSADMIQAAMDWELLINYMYEAHQGTRPQNDDYFIGDSNYGLFSRGVILPGRGAGVKVASIHPASLNAIPPQPSEQAIFAVIDEQTKAFRAILDGPAITAWKTASDSALAARYLSRQDSQTLLVMGSGPIAQALAAAYLHIRPSIESVILWGRTPEKLKALRKKINVSGKVCEIAVSLDDAVARADIIASATSSTVPLIKATFVRKGTHIDLVGSFRPDMQEAEPGVFGKSRVFVDDLKSAMNSGDLQQAQKEGMTDITKIEGDLFHICSSRFVKRLPDQITVYKNGGSAYLDLIVSQYVLEKLNDQM